MGRLLTLLAAVALLVAGLDLGATAAPLGCGSVVDHSQKLTANITNCGVSPALHIVAADVVLDLNGHTVDGTGFGQGVSGTGLSNVTVKNGIIRDFSIGVYFPSGSRYTVRSLRVFAGDYGVYLTDTTDSVVRSNSLTADHGVTVNGGARDAVSGNVMKTTTYGIEVFNVPDGLLFFGNRISSGNYGIDVQNGSRLRLVRNVIRGGATGIDVEGAATDITILANNVANTSDDGILVESGAVGIAIGRNTSTHNASDGIRLDGADPATSVGSNVTNDNGAYGIEAVAAVDDAGGNRAKGNTQFMQCRRVLCV